MFISSYRKIHAIVDVLIYTVFSGMRTLWSEESSTG